MSILLTQLTELLATVMHIQSSVHDDQYQCPEVMMSAQLPVPIYLVRSLAATTQCLIHDYREC